MQGVQWLLSTILVGITSYMIMAIFNFTDVKDKVTTFLVLFISQICLSMFVIGAVFQSLTNQTFLLFEVFIFVIVTFGHYRKTGHIIPRFKWRSWSCSHIRIVAAVYTLFLTLTLVIIAYLGRLIPPYAYDELAYHLVSVAAWIHSHRIVDTPVSMWANVYPKNAELVTTWLYLAVQGDGWIHLGQWLFAILAIAATMSVTRLLDLNRTCAIIAGTLFFLAPTVLLQATTAYNDLAFAAMFLTFFYFYLRLLRHPDWRYSLLCGLTAGMALGIKSSAVVYVGVCYIILAIAFFLLYRQRKITRIVILQHTFGLLVPLLIFGCYWYIHTWMIYGNPIYPFTVAVSGHVLFPGLGSVNQLIMIPNTPAVLLHKPWWQQVWISWTSIPTYYAYDMQVGGFGLQWSFIELPSLVLFTVYAIVRERKIFYQIILPLFIIFLLQPANWWGRYTLFMVALGTWSFVFTISRIRSNRLKATVYSLVLIIICGAYIAGGVVFMSANKRISSLVSTAVHNALHTPAAERTVGSVVFPEYRWVDKLAQPAHIGFTLNVQFPYPLFGRHAANDVVWIHDTSEQAFIQDIKYHDVQYLMTEKGDVYDEWAKRNRQLFQRYRSSVKYNVYQIRT